MPKYEIMIITDPQRDASETEKLVKDVFGNDIKFNKLDNTELAYEINKSKVASYFLVEADTDGAAVKEFTRRVNIEKTIWRQLAINLDSERQMETAQFTKNVAEVDAARKEAMAKRKAAWEAKKAARFAARKAKEEEA